MHPVVFAGAGPGDPRLLTLAAAEALQEADVVLYDDLGCAAVLEEHMNREADAVYVGKRGARDGATGAEAQAAICDAIVRRAQGGAAVVRLKGGDPSTFGRLQAELDACRAASVPFRVIPGVTSASAAAAALSVSLTAPPPARPVASLAVISAHGDLDWNAIDAGANNLAIFMGSRTVERVCETLATLRGEDAFCAAVRDASSAREAAWEGTLRGAADGELRAALQGEGTSLSPLMLLVGDGAMRQPV